jgi:hypothetical protein
MTCGVVFHVEEVKKISLRSQSLSQGHRPRDGALRVHIFPYYKKRESLVKSVALCYDTARCAPASGLSAPSIGSGGNPEERR